MWEDSLVITVTDYRLYGLGRDFSLHHIHTDSETCSVNTGDSFLRDEWSDHKFEWLPSSSAAKVCSELNCNALLLVYLRETAETLPS
jgi:hypothetical protein